MSNASSDTNCRLAIKLPPSHGGHILQLQLPESAELREVFAAVSRETHPAAVDPYFRLQACSPDPPHGPLFLTAAADGGRTLAACGLAPQAAIALTPIPGSGSPRRDRDGGVGQPAAPAPPSTAAETEEADRKALELEKAAQFCAFTGAESQTAATVLARVGWVLDRAIDHFFEAGLEEDEEEGAAKDAQDHDRPGAAAASVDQEAPADGGESRLSSGPPDMYTEAGEPEVEVEPERMLEPEPEPEPEPGRSPLPEGVTPPSARDAWRTHGEQARYLLQDWLEVGGLQSFGASWQEAGLDALEDLRALRSEGDAALLTALLPEPRPRIFEQGRLRRLLDWIDAEAAAQGTPTPRPPPHPGGADEPPPGSLGQWLSDAKLSDYDGLLVGVGGLVVADIPHVTNDELVAVGVDKEFHRKRFLRHGTT